jgi:protein tyrosine phosphatase (PTP) superfamily phosphohydrolase (DUF442 family)
VINQPDAEDPAQPAAEDSAQPDAEDSTQLDTTHAPSTTPYIVIELDIYIVFITLLEIKGARDPLNSALYRI